MNDIKAPSAFKIEAAISVWQSVRTRLLNEDGDLAHDEAVLTELLGDAEGDVKEILARVCRAAKHAEAMGDSAKAMVAKLVARQKRYEVRDESMRALAFAMMEALGTRREEWSDMTISVGAGRQGVHISDLDKVPNIYVEIKTQRIPDKATIGADLKAGRDVPGAELRNGAPVLTIRTS